MHYFYNKFHLYIFLFIVFLIFIYLSGFSVLLEGPFGIHYIRQTDSISFASNYLRNGFRFFHPEIYNLSSKNGNNACEFPIFYYLTAIIYKFIGEKDCIHRFWSFSISSVSLIYLYLLAFKFIQNKFLTLIVCLLCISSPVYLYYFFNFLPDSISLAFTLIAWYYFVQFYEMQKNKHWFLSIFFFTFASLLKATYFIHPIAAVSAYILTFILNKKKAENKSFNFYFIFLFIISILILLSWNIYMYWYNNINNATYFTTKPLPFWETSTDEKAKVFEHIRNYWFNNYYYPTLIHVFYFLICLHLFFWRKTTVFFHNILIFLFIGLTAYFFLFFMQFKNHDYYMLNMYPLYWFLSIISISKLFKMIIPKIKFIYIIFFVFILIGSLKHTHKIMQDRWNIDTSIDYYANIENKLKHTKKFIDKHNINSKSKWIIFTDRSPSGALLKIKRKGWNVIDTIPETVHLYPFYLSQKPNYILFTDKNYIQKYKTKNMVFLGMENENYIYKFIY